MSKTRTVVSKSISAADLRQDESPNEPLTLFKMTQLNEIAKPLTKLEALQLAIAMTPEKVLASEMLEEEEVRVAYIFQIAEMILMADRKKFGS